MASPARHGPPTPLSPAPSASPPTLPAAPSTSRSNEMRHEAARASAVLTGGVETNTALEVEEKCLKRMRKDTSPGRLHKKSKNEMVMGERSTTLASPPASAAKEVFSYVMELEGTPAARVDEDTPIERAAKALFAYIMKIGALDELD